MVKLKGWVSLRIYKHGLPNKVSQMDTTHAARVRQCFMN